MPSRESAIRALTAAGLEGADLDAALVEEGFEPVGAAKPEPKVEKPPPMERAVSRARGGSGAAPTPGPSQSPPKAPTPAVAAPAPAPVEVRAMQRMAPALTSTVTVRERPGVVVGDALRRGQDAVTGGVGAALDVAGKVYTAPAQALAGVYGSLGKMEAGMDRATERQAAKDAAVQSDSGEFLSDVRTGYARRASQPALPSARQTASVAEPFDTTAPAAKDAAAEALGMPPREPEVVRRPPPPAPATAEPAAPPADPLDTLDGATGYLLNEGYTQAELGRLSPSRVIAAAKGVRQQKNRATP